MTTDPTTETQPTTTRVARELADSFERAWRGPSCSYCGDLPCRSSALTADGHDLERFERVHRGASRDGETYYRKKDTAPEWVGDAVYAAHDNGAMLPDDWKYETIARVADDLTYALDNDDDLVLRTWKILICG